MPRRRVAGIVYLETDWFFSHSVLHDHHSELRRYRDLSLAILFALAGCYSIVLHGPALQSRCRHQYSPSFISALMSREGNKQLQTRHPGGEKLNFPLFMRLQDPRMATSIVAKTHARDNR